MKSLMKIGFAGIVLAMILTAFGCKTEVEPPHEHTFSAEWSGDDESHWHAATCEHTDEVSDKAEHTWGEGEVTKEATEEEEGETMYKCEVCKRIRTEAIAKVEHKHTISEEWTSDEDYHWHEANCGNEEHREAKAVHDWDDGTVITAATEETDGKMKYKCNVCGAEKDEAIPATGHIHTVAEEWTSDNTHHWHVADCGNTEHNTGKAIHDWNEGEVTKAATENTAGEKTYKCKICDIKKTEAIAALGHSHTISEDWTSDEDYHWHEASCGKAEHNEGKAAHEWDEGAITTVATEEMDGEKTYKCKNCNKTKTEAISALGHSHTVSEDWTSDETHHWHAADCGKKEHNTAKAVHTEDGGTVTVQPTTIAEGVITYKCSVCQRILRTENIEQLSVTLTFDLKGGTGAESITGKYGDSVTVPVKPYKAGYCFTGWTPALPDTFPSENTTYTAGWKDLLDNKVINGVTLEKTSEVVVIPAGTTATIVGSDDNWSGYLYVNAPANYKGVFINNRTVTLSSFVMAKYEVTQELYKAVLENDAECNATPSAASGTPDRRPVEMVTWYDAVYFCNALTRLTMSEEDCVYTITGLSRDPTDKYITYATSVTQDLTKKGYRLPTEAEWEYSARGGVGSETWSYAFAGRNVYRANKVYDSSGTLQTDENLSIIAYYNPVYYKTTQEVGKKIPNTLELYDMSGNVSEWCWDFYDSVVKGTVTNPTGPSSDLIRRVYRGGSVSSFAHDCAVSTRCFDYPYNRYSHVGFRLARSL